jgi:hypothetical protein
MKIISMFLPIMPTASLASAQPNSISWWFEVGEKVTTDQANLQVLKSHPYSVDRVMPDWWAVKGDVGGSHSATNFGIMFGDLNVWRDPKLAEPMSKAWLDPLKTLRNGRGEKVKILPWALDTTNATMVHEKIYPNQTKWIAEAVDIALELGFDGWHIY